MRITGSKKILFIFYKMALKMKSKIETYQYSLQFFAALGMTLLYRTQSFFQRPNIVYIMSDDHADQAISAYGGPLKT